MLRKALSGGFRGARVLEIGGGVGRLQAEILKAGAGTGEIVELVTAYEPYAEELARAAGVDDRTTFRVADILEDPAGTDPADIVVLNRVVCCTPDGLALTAEAARHARRTLVLSYPRDLLPIRWAVRVQNAAFRVMRRSFRAFVHSPGEIAAAAESTGARLVDSTRVGVWEVALFRATA